VKPQARARAWEHLHELAAEHGVKLHKAKSWVLAEAHVSTKQVWVPPTMRDVESYLIALHEFGHICQPEAAALQATTHVPSGLACEALAWGWAIEHADPALLRLAGASTWRCVGDCVASYLSDRALARSKR